MQADVIDYDELRTGNRQEGHYVGIWSISKKLAAALGVGIALAILGSSGYVPNVTQNEQVQLTLRILYALVPSVCNLLALMIAMRYPISGGKHKQILKAIDDRREGSKVVDPLVES